jgi:hypothetical protein
VALAKNKNVEIVRRSSGARKWVFERSIVIGAW